MGTDLTPKQQQQCQKDSIQFDFHDAIIILKTTDIHFFPFFASLSLSGTSSSSFPSEAALILFFPSGVFVYQFW